MSFREFVAGRGGVPRGLLVGPLIEVWSAPVAWTLVRVESVEAAGLASAVSAMRRWSEVRRCWLAAAGVHVEVERGHLVPAGGNPSRQWSAKFML